MREFNSKRLFLWLSGFLTTPAVAHISRVIFNVRVEVGGVELSESYGLIMAVILSVGAFVLFQLSKDKDKKVM